MKVALFVPCLIDQFRPSIAEATIDILISLEISVMLFPDQTCCGQPLYKMGYRNKTRKVAKKMIRLFENADHIVIPSGSCVEMIKKEYPQLMRDEGIWFERASDLSRRVHELSEFLVNTVKVKSIDASFPHRITFHDSCQVSGALGISEEPRILLKNVKGLELIEMEDPGLCCGFGGQFSIKFPWISRALLEEKVKMILQTNAEFVVSCEPSCLIHMEGYMKKMNIPVKAIHIAEVLAIREK